MTRYLTFGEVRVRANALGLAMSRSQTYFPKCVLRFKDPERVGPKGKREWLVEVRDAPSILDAIEEHDTNS